MPLPVYRLRRWLAVIAVLFMAVVAGMYLYARLRQRSVLRGFPGKISYDIKQTASGFQFSKSEAGRTMFTIRAKNVKEFKLNGRAELHDVTIILYGRDTSRFDQIYGDDFTFDPKSGNVTAKGEVQIDLEANPSGAGAPDQAAPKDLKNPIHLKTSNLVFNRDSGDAFTEDRVDFSTPQAAGWAVGVRYAAKSATLTLDSQIHVTINGQDAATLFAAHAAITREPREVILDHPVMKRESGTLQSEQATFFLGAENEVQRVLATGNVNAESASKDADAMRARSDEAELLLQGKQDVLRTATLTGNVHVERIGSQPMEGNAGRVVLDFQEVRGDNQLQKVHASERVRLAQHATSAHVSSPDASTPQDFDLAASAIDFFVAKGRRLDHAQTSGAAQITISPAGGNAAASASQRTVVTAGRFDAMFVATPEGSSRLTSIHGAPDAKIVSIDPRQPDRVITSQTVDAAFLPQGGIGSIIQQGSVIYTDGQVPAKRTQAWADRAVYTPADRILLLNGSPRVADGAMTTTAKTIRINHATDDAFADGDVKSTYSDLKEQPNGALLASASPIHVTAATMTAHNSPAIALYQGDARLWQDANIIEAPSIEFDRDRRSVVAQGTDARPVSTVLVQEKLSQPSRVHHGPARAGNAPPLGEHKANKKSEGKINEASPVSITAPRLTYADADRRAHYEGGVAAHGSDFSAAAQEMDVYLLPRTQTTGSQALSSQGRLDRMVAKGNVKLQEPGREADCQNLVYTASDDKFVLTGGPPSIFDAERGKITGVSLTFFRGDDRVLVEGEASTPVVTQTRVAR